MRLVSIAFCLALTALAEVLEDKDPAIQHAASKSLSQIGEPSKKVLGTIERTASRAEHPEVRSGAVVELAIRAE